jgi:ComF family protein
MTKPTEYNQLGSSVNCSVLSKVNRWLTSAHEWLTPPVCTLCGKHGEQGRDLCFGCAGDLLLVKEACLQCGAPLSIAGICGRCQRHPPAYDRTTAVFQYRPPLDALIKRLKFNGDLHLARLLGGLMADALNAIDIDLPELIVPVPLHYRRLRERGFNQALELARPIAARLGVPLDWRYVLRNRATDAQTDLPAKLRSRNVKGAFTVGRGLTARHVAIMDDVMTTGHTVNELATMLRRSGVKTISVWVCARAVFER